MQTGGTKRKRGRPKRSEAGRSQEFEMEEDLPETVPVVYANNTAMEKDTSQESSSRQSPSPPPSPSQPASSTSQPSSSPSQPPSSPYSQPASSTSQPSSQPSPLTAMERLKIRKRREITQSAHPIREAMPTLLLAMALLTSPTTVIATNYRYDTTSLSPTRSARSRMYANNNTAMEKDTSQEFEMEEDLPETVPAVYSNNNTAMEKDTSQESSSRQSPSPPPSLRPFTVADLKTRIIHSQPQKETSRFHLSLALSGNENVNIDISPSPGDAVTMSVTVTTNAPETV